MTKEVSINQRKDGEGFSRDIHKWISEINFVQDEIVFVKKMLNSDVFEPGTANLFERIREYIGLLESFERELATFETGLQRHEVELGTLIEINSEDHSDVETEHMETALRLEQITRKFQMLKSGIFEYTAGIFRMKRR